MFFIYKIYSFNENKIIYQKFINKTYLIKNILYFIEQIKLKIKLIFNIQLVNLKKKLI